VACRLKLFEEFGAAGCAQASRRAARVLRHPNWAFEPGCASLKIRQLADLEQRHAALAGDPDYAKYLAATEGLVVAQEDRMMRPVEFKGRS
jgi:hypothetical protein